MVPLGRGFMKCGLALRSRFAKGRGVSECPPTCSGPIPDSLDHRDIKHDQFGVFFDRVALIPASAMQAPWSRGQG